MYKIKYVMQNMSVYINDEQYQSLNQWDKSFYAKVTVKKAVPKEVVYEELDDHLGKLVNQSYN